MITGKNERRYPISDKNLAFEINEGRARALELTTANTVLKKTEEKLTKMNRLYSFISHINKTITHVNNAHALFDETCKIAVKYGNFKMAWIGLIDFELQEISLEEESGILPENLHLFKNVHYEKDGPQGYVLKTGNYFVCNNIAEDLRQQKWKKFALKNGIKSCIILPIKKLKVINRSLNLYSTELNFFDTGEIEMLKEVAEDISFGIDFFEKENKQKSTEEVLMHSEKRFRALIENSTDIKTLSNEEGKVLYCSPSVHTWLGFTQEEFALKHPEDLIHPDELKHYLENRAEVAKIPGKSFKFQHRRMHKNGHWVWCEGTITNMLEDPAIQALVSNFRDISEIKVLEQQREFNSNNLDALINNTNDLMWSVDTDFNLITSNEPFDEMAKTNFGKPIMKGTKVLSNSYTPKMRMHFKKLYERAFSGETFSQIEHFDTPAELWAEIFYCPIRKGNEVIGAACHSHNITKEKLAEQNLRQSEERLKEAQVLSHIGNWEVNLITGVNIWSDEFYNIFGLKPGALQPSPETFLSLLHPDDMSYARKEVDQTFKTYKEGSFSSRFNSKDNHTGHLYSQWRFESDKNGKPIRLYGILQDITERKIAEEEREQMITDMLQRNRDLEQFTFIISHNLRAPMANIIGFANLLRDEAITPDERKQFLSGLSVSVTKLDEVTIDLNKILQIKRNGDEKKETIRFTDIVSDVLISIDSLVARSDISIKSDFYQIDEIYSIKGYLYSIFYNLINNSIKYRKPGKHLSLDISSKKENGNIILTFKDNGLGIDTKKYGDKLFKLYSRFHSHVEGKGMGLFMIKTQAELIGGKISVVSEPNEGAEFTIVFQQ